MYPSQKAKGSLSAKFPALAVCEQPIWYRHRKQGGGPNTHHPYYILEGFRISGDVLCLETVHI